MQTNITTFYENCYLDDFYSLLKIWLSIIEEIRNYLSLIDFTINFQSFIEEKKSMISEVFGWKMGKGKRDDLHGFL